MTRAQPGWRAWCPALLALALCAGCKASYPKERLDQSVRELFKKELGAEVRQRLAGRTLYVAFALPNLVTKNFELPKDATEKLEAAMLSVSRIALSTDADIQFTVIEADDPVWGIRTVLIRKMQDLKDLLYWKVSKADFDERLVLEIEQSAAARAQGSTATAVARAPFPEQDWHDIALEEYMARWVASRINLGVRLNPFLGVLLGIERLDARYEPEDRTLRLAVSGFESQPSTGSVSLDLLKSSVEEQMAQVEKKYQTAEERARGGWASRVVVEDAKGRAIFELKPEEWRAGPDGSGKGKDLQKDVKG